MTTTVTVVCDACKASYQVPKERAGARFKCKKCSATLTVPRTDSPAALATPSIPIPPPVALATPSVPIPPPADRPAGATDAPSAARRPRTDRPGRADRPERPSARPLEPAVESKSKLNLILLVILGIAVLAIGGYFAWPKAAPIDTPKRPDPGTLTASSQDGNSPTFDAAKRVSEFKKETGSATAPGLWTLVKKIDDEAKVWKEKKAPDSAIEELMQSRELAVDEIVKINPDHAEARAARGEVKYNDELEPFFDAPYLSDSERDLVRKNRLSITTRAGENAGWISKKLYDMQVAPLVDKLSLQQKAAESMAASDFGRSAKSMEAETLTYLNKQLEGKAAFRAFIHKPYLIFVEENPGWSPQAEAKGLFSPLKAILEAFMKEFGGLGLAPLDVPVPVLYFVSEERYREYNKSIGNTGMNVLAHYEPGSGRLALNRGVNHEVIIHEGTHQIFDKYTKNMLPHPKQSFWFQEGVAEWFGGSNRLQDKDGSWTYETGVLLDERLTSWRSLESSQFKLADLLNQTYGKRNEYLLQGGAGQAKIGLVYAQGWFLIYFMNHFNVDATGLVRIGEKGKYADRWSEYLKAELQGRTGKKVFMEMLKIDDAGLETMHKEFVDYFNFVQRKKNIGQVKSKKLVAWDKYVNLKGQKNGTREDDLLIPPERKAESGPASRPK